MAKLKKESMLSLILIVLIITSIIQIGIHWNQQSQGFPIDLLSNLFGNSNPDYIDVDKVKADYFLPESITVSKEPLSQWVFTKDNSYYLSIWHDVEQNYLPEILKEKPKKILSKESWGSLLRETCIKIDFSVNYPKELVLWFVKMDSGENLTFIGIKSIAIFPQHDVNETLNIVYVYDELMVYMYEVDINDNALQKEYYRDLPEIMQNQTKVLPMSAIGEGFSTITENMDIPVFLDSDSGRSMQTINSLIPESLTLNPDSDNLESIQENILLNQKASFIPRYDPKTNTAVFSDLENVYKLDANGILEYKYLPADSSPAGDIKTAFINALSFIELRKKLVGDVDIVLSDIVYDADYYEFKFDYQIENTRILISDSSAIDIKSSAKRVIECKWVIRQFTGNNDYSNYKLYFVDLVENPDILIDSEKFIDIQIGYDARINSINTLSPSWLVTTDAGEYVKYVIPLSEEED